MFDLYRHIGARLRSIRKSKDFDLREASKLCSIPPVKLMHIEDGEVDVPFFHFYRILSGYNVCPLEFFSVYHWNWSDVS